MSDFFPLVIALPGFPGVPAAPPHDSERDTSHDLVTGNDSSTKDVSILPEFKRVDEVWDGSQMILKDGATRTNSSDDDPYGVYCFIIIRHADHKTGLTEWIKVELRSQWLKHTCGAIIGSIDDISWNSCQPVRVSPDIFIRYFPLIDCHLAELTNTQADEAHTAQLRVLVDFIRAEYASKFEDIRTLFTQKQITFELLPCLFLPNTLLLYHCPVTGEPRAARLAKLTFVPAERPLPAFWDISAVYIETAATRTGSQPPFGFSHQRFTIWDFKGVSNIHDLHVHPFYWHPRAEELHAQLIERGKKWQQLNGLHHMRYDGIAYRFVKFWRGRQKIMISVGSRVMIDPVLYRETSADLPDVIRPDRDSRDPDGNGCDLSPEQFPLLSELSDDQLLLTTPILYGFSLGDKHWLHFNVVHIAEITWNDEAFNRLVLPRAHKDLIRGLVEAHTSRTSKFDDFVEGKGRGLVINLFGPPGVGKTMSAEAVSEHLRRPLYMIGAGELGTTPAELESALSSIFRTGTQWGSVTLLDEADVFMEQRSPRDFERNALVAIFLRQLEYFPGLLFLTTNRVRAFDRAFQSRIHVSLRYRELAMEARREVWGAFLANLTNFGGPLSPAEEESLFGHQYNGRQIKNLVRTASALADSRGEKVSYAILCEVVNIMDEFEADTGVLGGFETM